MSCQGKCKDCGHWEVQYGHVGAGICLLAIPKDNTSQPPLSVSNSYLFTREDFGCNQFRERRGREFVRLVEEAYCAVDKEYADVARKPRGVAFAILMLLDGSGEHWSGESRYRVFAEEDGVWRLVEFAHHDLK